MAGHLINAGYAVTVFDINAAALDAVAAKGATRTASSAEAAAGMDTAKNLNVSLPASALAQQLFSSLLANGYGDLDHSAVIKAIEMLSNVLAARKA